MSFLTCYVSQINKKEKKNKEKKRVWVAGFVRQPYKLNGHFDKYDFMLDLFYPIHSIKCCIELALLIDTY